MPLLPTHLVVDAFGTIAHLSRPTRPYARLRDFLGSRGAIVEDFAFVAMTQSLDLAGMAAHYGIEVPGRWMEQLERSLFEEVEGLCLSTAAIACMHRLMAAGVVVVIGSNLALPYGIVLKQHLQREGLVVGPLGDESLLGCAFSYEMGCVKPSLAFYGTIATAYPNRSVFMMVGDKQEEDHDAPIRLGWQAAPPLPRSKDALEWTRILTSFNG